MLQNSLGSFLGLFLPGRGAILGHDPSGITQGREEKRSESHGWTELMGKVNGGGDVDNGVDGSAFCSCVHRDMEVNL